MPESVPVAWNPRAVARNTLFDFPRVFYAPLALYRDIRRGRATAGWAWVLLYCLIYVGAASGLAASGTTPFVAPWLRLPLDRYYFIEAFFILPVVFLAWIMGAGVVRGLGMLLGGKGRFETMLVATAYCLWVPWYPLIVADSIPAIPLWLYDVVLAGSAIWFLVSTTLAVKAVEDLGWWRSILCCVVAVGAVSLFVFTYIR